MMKSYCFLFTAFLIFGGCALQEKGASAEQEFESQVDQNQLIENDLNEIRSSNDALKKENEELRSKMDRLEKALEKKEQVDQERLESMEDLISLMEKNVREIEEENSTENLSANRTSGKILNDNSSQVEVKPETLNSSGGFQPVSPKSISDLPPVYEEKEAGGEPFGEEVLEDKNYSDADLQEPVNYPDLNRNPKAKRYYLSAYVAYTQKDYQIAIDRFNDLIRRFPNDQYTDNAYFWIGMSYYNLDLSDKAEIYFRNVLNSFKHGRTAMGFKTPDSIYMLGTIREKQKKYGEARYYYNYLIQKYPDSGSAKNAKNKLRLMALKSS